MGVSTNGQVCYGILLEEGIELPWHDECDEQTWWRTVQNFVNPITSPYDARGEYREGYDSEHPDVNRYFAAQRAWDLANPMPVVLVNYCSGNYPMWIIAVPSSVTTCIRGTPTSFDPDDFAADARDDKLLRSFCEEYDIKCSGLPNWYLSSCWM